MLPGDMTQEESGPNEIPDTGLFELTQRTEDNPEVCDRVHEEEMLCRDDEEESQRSPSQSVISGVPKHRRHLVPDTVDESSMLWHIHILSTRVLS